MDWIWLLLPFGLIGGVCAGLWVRSRARKHADIAAGYYGGSSASSTYGGDSGGDGGGGD